MSINHRKYYIFGINKNFEIKSNEADNDLGADASYGGYMEEPDNLFAMFTTDTRWKSWAEDIAKRLKAGESVDSIREDYGY